MPDFYSYFCDYCGDERDLGDVNDGEPCRACDQGRYLYKLTPAAWAGDLADFIIPEEDCRAEELRQLCRDALYTAALNRGANAGQVDHVKNLALLGACMVGILRANKVRWEQLDV